MPLPHFEAKANKKVNLKVFAGLDKRDKIGDSSFTEMINMSPDAIPALSVRKGRKKIADLSCATNICAPEFSGGELSEFTGVMNGDFYYKGIKAIGEKLSDGVKSIADFNGKICIFPDKVYYDYLPNPQTGEADNRLISMEKTIAVKGATFYSSKDEASGYYTAYISLKGAGFNENFSEGDSIVISGCTAVNNNVRVLESRKDFAAENNIVSAVIQGVTQDKIDLILYNKKGEKVTFTNTTESAEITLKVAIPDMNHICVHNNRLWGTATSGEYIYASKLGDCTNFNSFAGLSDDSWYSNIATGGEFTGICSYRSAVVAFKRNHIHHIYGDAPVNFSIPKQTFGGCIDGKSIQEIEGVLYYLSYDGFKGYSGGEPYNISPQLKENYVSAASGYDGKHYYAAAKTQDGKRDLLVYTPLLDAWVREDDKAFVDFCNYNGCLYAITDNEMLKLNEDGEKFIWCVVSKRFTYDIIEHKGLSEIWIRLDAKEETEITVSISRDGGDFEECTTLSGIDGLSVRRVPVRFGKCDSFRIKLEGEGNAVIHDIEISTHNGGRIYEG